MDLINFLSKKGYNVKKFSENVISNIYIYSNVNYGLSSINNILRAEDSGSLIIDADGKNNYEIEKIIRYRTYSPLFTTSRDEEAINSFKRYIDEEEI